MKVQNETYYLLAVSKHIAEGIGHYTIIFYENMQFFEVDNIEKAIVYPPLDNKKGGEQFKFIFFFKRNNI